MDKNERSKIGVGVIVVRNHKVLLGKRKGAHGEGSWCFPGGHLEFKETIEDCARQETLEETGLTIEDIKMGTFTNDIFDKENKHYVTLYAISKSNIGEARVMEPDKCEEWKWFEWNNLPKPLFIPIQNLLKQNYNPFE